MIRSPAELDRIATAINPERVFCFLPRDGLTTCNCLVTCFCAALGLEVPPLLANLQHAWLSDAANGWRDVDVIEAGARADLGFPVVASWLNPTGGHGHIAMVTGTEAGHLMVCAAGSRNFRRARIEQSFGLSIHPMFFTTE